MKEDFLHYIWKFQKFNAKALKTASGEAIVIYNQGSHNLNAGPDFFNAQVRIDTQLWAGNVEIHINASDWFVHHHEKDKNYDNVILHVVWHHDIDIPRKNNTIIPTLVLKEYISSALLKHYQELYKAKQQWIQCETQFPFVNDFKLQHFIERLYVERLEAKAKTLAILLEASHYDWEATLFKILAKGFGLKVNSYAFFQAACQLDFSIVNKLRNNLFSLEALFFGSFGLLTRNDIETQYYQELQKEYQFIQHKYQSITTTTTAVQFFRIRPANFPTIRLSQLAMLYHKEAHLFDVLMKTSSLEKIYSILQVSTTDFWETHYTFEREAKQKRKIITKSFVNSIILNCILPLKFLYQQKYSVINHDKLFKILDEIPYEKNKITNTFQKFNVPNQTALQSQAYLQLKNEYCNQKKCLQCVIGNSILNQ